MNKRYHILKERLNHTEEWMERFLEVEEHREISKKALRQVNKDKPILGLIFTIVYLPSKIWDAVYTIIWWNRYYKCCKEIKIMRKELEKYD